MALKTLNGQLLAGVTYLALTSTSTNAGINGQYLNTGTSGQEWVFEPPTGFTVPA